MSFTSVPFLVLVAAGLLLYRLVPQKLRWCVLLAVSCVTVSVCCNALMVQDKVSGARRDLTMTPVRRSTLALSYYFATIISTLIICILALGAGMLYLAKVGWYMSAGDVFLLLSDVVLLVLFGTALSSVINFFLSSQGQISAVGTIISAGYGFICGAYIPVRSRSAKGHQLPARHLRHEPAAESCAPWGVCGNGSAAVPGGNH